jgi:uncharacterized protein YqgC (DUF456 family)
METSEEKKSCETKKCGCFCHKMPGVFVVLVGVAVLLRALDVLQHTPFWITVAVLVILAGLQNIISGCCKCCDKA